MGLLDTLTTKAIESVRGLPEHLQDTEKLGQIGLSPENYNVISAMNAADNMNSVFGAHPIPPNNSPKAWHITDTDVSNWNSPRNEFLHSITCGINTTQQPQNPYGENSNCMVHEVLHPEFNSTDNQTFSLDTTHLETASLLGVYLDAGSYLKKFNEADDESLPKIVTDFKNQVTSVLSGQDWSGNNLVSMMSKASIANIIQVCAIAAGMDKFCKQKGAKNWNIVHNKIDAYYKAEIKNPFTKTEGGKANTADCVVCDSSISSFLKNMESQKIYYDSNGLCRLETGEKFFQISLKKAEGEAQLGKITSDFAAKFGMISNNDLVNMLVHEGTELNE